MREADFPGCVLHGIFGLPLQLLGRDHEQVDVAVGLIVASGLRAEEDDALNRPAGPDRAGPAFAARLIQMAADRGVKEARIVEVQIGLCALDGGATELWTHDGGFVKIPRHARRGTQVGEEVEAR